MADNPCPWSITIGRKRVWCMEFHSDGHVECAGVVEAEHTDTYLESDSAVVTWERAVYGCDRVSRLRDPLFAMAANVAVTALVLGRPAIPRVAQAARAVGLFNRWPKAPADGPAPAPVNPSRVAPVHVDEPGQLPWSPPDECDGSCPSCCDG
jgi:hypothetical protein